MRIGIFGGSFNPVHRGHLKLALDAMSELNLSRIFFVPSYQSPLKQSEALLPQALRLSLLRRALRNHPHFKISLCEIKRKGVSYTVDTLKYFKKRFGERSTIFFLSGADTLRHIRRWKSLKDVLRLCRFVVMTRPGYRPRRLLHGTMFLPFNALNISASEIRDRLWHRKSVKGLVPEGCEPELRNYFKRKGT